MWRDAAMKGIFSMLIWVFVLTSRDGNTQNFYFRNGFYFRYVAADTGYTGRHLYKTQRAVGVVRKSRRSTKQENILSRIRVGHTMLNKTLKLINKHPTGLCEQCGLNEWIGYTLVHTPTQQVAIMHLNVGATRHKTKKKKRRRCIVVQQHTRQTLYNNIQTIWQW